MRKSSEARAEGAQGSEFQSGDLIRLVSRHPSSQVILGSLRPDLMDACVPSGTVCMVRRLFTADYITSEDAYVVVMEHEGALRDFWIYRSEMSLVSRP